MPPTISVLEIVWLLAGLVAINVSAHGLRLALRDWHLVRHRGLAGEDGQLHSLARVNLAVEVLRMIALVLLACNAGLAMLTPSRTDVLMLGVNVAGAWTLAMQGGMLLAILTMTVGALVLRWQRRKLMANGGGDGTTGN